MTKAEKENSLAIPGQESIPEEPEPEPAAVAVRITHIVPNSSVVHLYHYVGVIRRRGSMVSSASDVLRRVYTRPTTRTTNDDHRSIFSSSLFALLLSQLMALPWLYHRTLALLFHPLLLVPPTLHHRPSPPTPPLLEDVQTLFTICHFSYIFQRHPYPLYHSSPSRHPQAIWMYPFSFFQSVYACFYYFIELR